MRKTGQIMSSMMTLWTHSKEILNKEIILYFIHKS